MDYVQAKWKLGYIRSDLEYFTPEFFETFLADQRRALEDSALGIIAEEYQGVKKTDFYRKNGGCYCSFLELISSDVSEFTAYFYEGDIWNGKEIFKAKDYDHAKRIAAMLAHEKGCSRYELQEGEV